MGDGEIHIGVDPGWKNLGLAILHSNGKDVKRIYSGVLNPSVFPNIPKFIEHFDEVIVNLTPIVTSVTIERFVAYNSIHTVESEDITMIIGALSWYFGNKDTWNNVPTLLRAIDWKTALVKALFKKRGFSNPSANGLDKKFSIAAAKSCLTDGSAFETDHEADAICLAAHKIYV